MNKGELGRGWGLAQPGMEGDRRSLMGLGKA